MHTNNMNIIINTYAMYTLMYVNVNTSILHQGIYQQNTSAYMLAYYIRLYVDISRRVTSNYISIYIQYMSKCINVYVSVHKYRAAYFQKCAIVKCLCVFLFEWLPSIT